MMYISFPPCGRPRSTLSPLTAADRSRCVLPVVPGTSRIASSRGVFIVRDVDDDDDKDVADICNQCIY